MKKIKKTILTGLLSLSFMGTVLVFYPLIKEAKAQGGSINCGPLYSNSSGTKYCCGNTNQEHCHAAACDDGFL